MYSYGPPHMTGQKKDEQLELTFSSYVRIRDMALKTYQRRWTIGRSGERGSGISVPAAWHDDDDDDIHMHLGVNMSEWVCMHRVEAYVYVYASEIERIRKQLYRF